MAMMKGFPVLIALISIIISLSKQPSFSYVTLDTNTLSALTNSSNVIESSGITNLNINTITEPPFPNSYLSSGKIEVEKPELAARRFDLIYWIAMPAIYYLTMTLMYTKNEGITRQYSVDNTDLNYVYFNTFFIPLTAAYFDYIYLQDQYTLKAKTLGIYCPNDLFYVSIPVFHFEF